MDYDKTWWKYAGWFREELICLFNIAIGRFSTFSLVSQRIIHESWFSFFYRPSLGDWYLWVCAAWCRSNLKSRLGECKCDSISRLLGDGVHFTVRHSHVKHKVTMYANSQICSCLFMINSVDTFDRHEVECEIPNKLRSYMHKDTHTHTRLHSIYIHTGYIHLCKNKHTYNTESK